MKNVGKMEERGYDIKIESVAKKKYTSPSKNVDFSIGVSELLQIAVLFYSFQIIPRDYTTGRPHFVLFRFFLKKRTR